LHSDEISISSNQKKNLIKGVFQDCICFQYRIEGLNLLDFRFQKYSPDTHNLYILDSRRYWFDSGIGLRNSYFLHSEELSLYQIRRKTHKSCFSGLLLFSIYDLLKPKNEKIGRICLISDF